MVKLKNVQKMYKTKTTSTIALKDINVEFENRGLYIILGPSGSGKTTLLNLIGCLDKVDLGDVIIDEQRLNDKKDKDIDKLRNEMIGFIFQDYSLIQNLTAFENIKLPTNINKISKKKIQKSIEEIAKKLDIISELNKYPSQLSGGQQQRVAIARAIINEPKIILADEPTGALDSDNAKLVMEYLKDISEKKLVIMVSHNEQLAEKYGDSVIKLYDGKITSIESKNKQINDNKNNKEKRKFKFVSLITSAKLAICNLLRKRVRSFFTILGSCIGILAACVVISISNSMENYSEYAQKQALSSYPITISSSLVETEMPNDGNDKKYEEYPNDNKINIINEYTSYYSHINVFSNDYIEYLKGIDPSLYTTMDYGNFLSLNIISKVNNQYSYVGNTSYLKEMNSNKEYLESEYELLYGDDYPSEMNELALVIDKNNCIDAYVLNYLQIDYKNIDSYTFEEICEKEFKVIYNNDYYKYNSQYDRYEVYASEYDEEKMKELYDNSNVTLKITAVLRQKKNASNVLYKPGILYTSKLTEYMYNNNLESNIVKDQLKFGLEKNVLSGAPYTDTISDFYVSTKEYKLETNLRTLGYYFNISYIKIYTDKFENRTKINEYLQAYNNDKDLDRKVLYSDYMGNIAKEFENFINILMTVFLVFSCVSLIVSGIMIALLMYVSVIERSKEIGILRTLGYSKINVSFTFITEGAIIGFVSGVLGIILSLVLTKPILRFVANVVKQSYSSTYDVSTITSTKFNILQLFIVLIGSIIIAMIASLLPAILAAKKDPIKSIKTNGV